MFLSKWVMCMFHVNLPGCKTGLSLFVFAYVCLKIFCPLKMGSILDVSEILVCQKSLLQEIDAEGFSGLSLGCQLHG